MAQPARLQVPQAGKGLHRGRGHRWSRPRESRHLLHGDRRLGGVPVPRPRHQVADRQEGRSGGNPRSPALSHQLGQACGDRGHSAGAVPRAGVRLLRGHGVLRRVVPPLCRHSEQHGRHRAHSRHQADRLARACQGKVLSAGGREEGRRDPEQEAVPGIRLLRRVRALLRRVARQPRHLRLAHRRRLRPHAERQVRQQPAPPDRYPRPAGHVLLRRQAPEGQGRRVVGEQRRAHAAVAGGQAGQEGDVQQDPRLQRQDLLVVQQGQLQRVPPQVLRHDRREGRDGLAVSADVHHPRQEGEPPGHAEQPGGAQLAGEEVGELRAKEVLPLAVLLRVASHISFGGRVLEARRPARLVERPVRRPQDQVRFRDPHTDRRVHPDFLHRQGSFP